MIQIEWLKQKKTKTNTLDHYKCFKVGLMNLKTEALKIKNDKSQLNKCSISYYLNN